MKRRAFLTSGTALFLAGCSSNSGGRSTTNTNHATTIDTTTLDKTTTIEKTTTRGAYDVSIDQSGWKAEGEEIEVLLTNNEETTPLSVQMFIQWFDQDGEYLGHDSISLDALGPQKSWYALIEPSTPFGASDFRITAPSQPLPSDFPENIDVEILEVAEETVEGVLINQNTEEVDLTILFTGYDGGWVTRIGSIRDSMIPAETNWHFKFPTYEVSPTFSGVNDTLILVG